jgi:hypothetical protein
MDSCLCQPIPTSFPPWRKYSTAPTIPGYTQITSLTPIIKEFIGDKADGEGQLQADQLFARVHDFEGSGSCIVETVGKKKRKAYCKVTHLLDPIRTIQKFYGHPEKGERRRESKISNPMNQAYVDSLANYLLGQVRERGLSPHFCLFYGGFQGVAQNYRFNITDEYDSYRKYKKFWEHRRQGLFSLYLKHETEDGEEETTEEDVNEAFGWLTQTPKSSLHSSSFSYSTRKTSKSDSSHISFTQLNDDDIEDIALQTNGVELESLHPMEEMPELEELEEEKSEEGSDSEEGSEDDSEENELEMYAEFKEFPTMLIFQEEMEGVLDDLLDEDEDEKHDEEWEKRWAAWTFQIISALCVAQGVLGFTHNDLHTNNIVWTETDQPYLFYKNRAGQVWRVPTFGKIFRIIDFGRAIFRVGDKWFASDDYERGGDAEGQYNFEAIRTMRSTKPKVYPNPSFDLCRYAVSVLEGLFPTRPAELIDGVLISKEDDWEIHETESPLFNLLWSWTMDDKGCNVLHDEHLEERFPDFDLYVHIGAHVHGAKPQEQLQKTLFDQFKMDASKVGEWETIYPLFC